jgi:hypothetical protein
LSESKTGLWVVAGLLFLALVGVAFYKVYPLINPTVAVRAPLNPQCSLRDGPCEVVFPDGATVRFSIEPRAIPVVKPLRFEVEIQGMEATAVEIDFQGTDMNMGFNRAKLAANGEGRFAGDGMLPVCVREAMEWEAKVLIATSAGLMEAPFRFITVQPGMPLPAY